MPESHSAESNPEYTDEETRSAMNAYHALALEEAAEIVAQSVAQRRERAEKQTAHDLRQSAVTRPLAWLLFHDNDWYPPAD